MKKLIISKLKILLIITFLLFIYISISAISYAQNISSNISNNVFRLHVLANSNSKEDQKLKIEVRDELLKYMNSICSNCNSKASAVSVVFKNKEIFEKIANKTIQDKGYNYPVKVNIGSYNFPTKQYGDITLPAGYYDALRIEIGEAKGHNWWCVMFPPLCFIDASSGIVPEESKELLNNNLSQEEFALISNNKNINIKFKFKILEFLNENGLITAKK